MPECQKLKKDGLNQHGPEHFEVQPFDTTGPERVNLYHRMVLQDALAVNNVWTNRPMSFCF